MATDKRSTVKVYPSEREALAGLLQALRDTYGVKASREDAVGAMLHGVSVHQLSGMLSEYLKHEEWGEGSVPEKAEAE